MSRVYFHSPSGEAELWGGERAWLGSVVSDVALGVLGLDHSSERMRELITPGHYLRQTASEGSSYLSWRRSLETSLSVGDGTLAWNGHDVDQFSLMLNTAARIGGDPLKLAARIHGQCEIHCWCEGIDRAWLAGIIDQGLESGVFRRNTGYADRKESWEGIRAFLLDRDDEPVVMSHSVCESFPNQYDAGWTPPEDPDWIPEWYRDNPDDWASLNEDEREDAKSDYDSERWYELPTDEKWRLGMDALRAKPGGLRIDPAEWQDFSFGHGLTMLDLLASDYRERLDAKFPAAAMAGGSRP